MKVLKLGLYTILSVMLCSGANAYTLTFDDISAGGYIDNATHYGAYFDGGFSVADHSDSAWGRPHSGDNVLVNQGIFSDGMLKFKSIADQYELYSVYSLSAYFSTAYGKQIIITGYNLNIQNPVSSARIGGVGESWDNVYITFQGATGQEIDFFIFEGVDSPADLLGFCADDMTIEPVPEPSSITALGAGLISLGSILVRRRQQRI